MCWNSGTIRKQCQKQITLYLSYFVNWQVFMSLFEMILDLLFCRSDTICVKVLCIFCVSVVSKDN